MHWLIAPDDRFLVPSPISHIGGSIYAFEMPVMLGTSAVLMDQWDAVAGLALMRDRQITHMAGATPFLEQLLAAAQAAEERLPDLKLFVCGGAGVPPGLIEDAAAHFSDAVVTRVYGSTEVPVVTVGTIDRHDVAHAAHTDGRAGIAEVRLVSSDIPGGLEIVARGPQMLVGYHRAEDEAAAFDADGFFRTGDLGHFIDEDYLVISGRAKDIIIRNGENIAPKEIEDLLAAHPAVAEVAIVGLPDPKTGERACAVVVPRNGRFPALGALTAFLRSAGVASFKLPQQLELWDALPKNATGKVVKHEIRATLMAQG
jgi:acyl-CoA synthetase (AMP-forming)/AMP-acid ligase II